ncbi:hypothetical protein D9M72_505980 [compost metagenome]
MLREGVLYVLLERAGKKKWTGYMVHPHGYLSPFNPQLTPMPAEAAASACEVVIRGANKSLVWVPDPTSVTNLWYFFHPDVVLPDVLQKLRKTLLICCDWTLLRGPRIRCLNLTPVRPANWQSRSRNGLR